MNTQSIALFELQQKFHDSIERVQGGESFALTKNGEVVAKLVAEGTCGDENKMSDWVDKIEALQKRIAKNHPKAEKVLVKDLIEEGRM